MSALPPVITSDAALHYGYSNESNPFNDASLSSVFVWRKKLEADAGRGGDSAAAAAVTEEELRARQRRLVQQIEEVKRRRAEREEERAALELVKAQQERERLAEHVAGWEEKEEEFHKQQAKMKTRIRMREKREKAIDLLLQNVAFEQWSREDEEQRRQQQQHDAMMAAAGAGAAAAAAGAAVSSSQAAVRARRQGSSVTQLQVTDPVSLLSALSLPDLLETRAEVDKFIELKEEEPYWQALRQLCDDEIRICRREKRDRGVSSAVLKQIDAMLAGRSRAELERLELQVHASMQEVGADVPYWTAVMAELRLTKAVAFLRELHADLLRRRLTQLKAEKEKRRREEEEARREGSQSEDRLRLSRQAEQGGGQPTAAAGEQAELRVAVSGGSAALPDVDDSNADHHLSPRLFSLDEELDVDVVSAADDERQLQAQRLALTAQHQPDAALLHPAAAAPSSSSSSSPPPAAASHEYSISNELALPASAAYSWRSAHRPRKPRYFNRVKTGFDWNRYNQTHYDKDSPPPKIVQGYKFNVFYPDLIDRSCTPKYRLEPLPAAVREGEDEAGGGGSSSEYCMLRFIGGAPYEDVAFKIVRREWEFAPRRGFRCVFDKGVLMLHFNFKRFFYRR